MYKVAVIGGYDSIYGFAALGLDTYPVENSAEGVKIFRQLADGGYGVIYITEALAGELSAELEKYKEQYLPAVIQIPGVSGNTGAGIAGVKKSVEQAIGSDIIFGEQ
ncbi:MAG: V-type ATP synthase subunit F [Lachnospiraceae bacterium]|nr:V-type ATP synthase subunit F [Lachnospiraceae bacterium]